MISNSKAVRPDNICIEVCKFLKRETLSDSLNYLMKLYKVKTNVRYEWRRNTLNPMYKNNGDIQNCGYYRGIKLLTCSMKLWERVIEMRLRKETPIIEPIWFYIWRSIMKAIYLLRLVMEQYQIDPRDSHLIFIDLENVYDRVPKEIV